VFEVKKKKGLKNRFLSKKNLNPNILATTTAGIWANQMMHRVIFFQKKN
jgi:hypothetical protein